MVIDDGLSISFFQGISMEMHVSKLIKIIEFTQTSQGNNVFETL